MYGLISPGAPNLGMKVNLNAIPRNNTESGIFAKQKWLMSVQSTVFSKCSQRFKYTASDEDIFEMFDTNFFERILYEDGVAGIWNHPTFGVIAIRTVPSSQLNFKEECSVFTTISPVPALSGREFNIYKDDDFVVCYNKPFSPNVDLSDQFIFMNYIDQLVNIKVSQSINQIALRTPVLLSAPIQQKKAILEQYNQLAQNTPFMLIDSNYKKLTDGNQVEVFDLKATNNLESFQQYYNDLYSEMMTELGVFNLENKDKKERMIVDEANANNAEVLANLDYRLNTRKKAIKELNRKFGLKLEVSINDAFINRDDSVRYDNGSDASNSESESVIEENEKRDN